MSYNLSKWKKVWLSKSMEPKKTGNTLVINGVEGFLIPGDAYFIFNLAASLRKGGAYLEVGSWKGLSSILFTNGLIANLNFATVYCVDTWKGNPGFQQNLAEVKEDRLYEIFLKNVEEAQVSDFIHPVRGKSTEIAETWKTPLDMAFIDGDHSFKESLADMRAWKEHLKPGGRMLGHDASNNSGVREALETFKKETGISYKIYDNTYYIWELNL